MIKIAFASLASLAMATAADAAFILQYTQNTTVPSASPVVFSPNGAGETISSTGTGVQTPPPPTNGTWIPVNVTIGSLPGAQPVPAFMSFTSPLTTTSAATTNGTTVNQAGYTGTIEFNFAPSSTSASNILTVQFSGGTLSGIVGGNAAGLTDSQPPNNVTYSSVLFPTLVAGLTQRDFTINFTGLANVLTSSGAGTNTASTSGSFSGSVVPEPTSIVMLSISALGGLGFYGVRRFKA